MNVTKNIVIIDNDRDAYKNLSQDENYGKVDIILAQNTKIATKLIDDMAIGVYGFFISPHMDGVGSTSLIKMIIRKRPTTPVFYVTGMNADINADTICYDKGLPVCGHIAKPFVIKDLLVKIKDQITFFCSQRAKELAARNLDKVDAELDETDDSFMSIRLEQFLSGTQSIFDIYIKLRKDKYVKILQAGDTFDVERVEYYASKGAVYLYIRKDIQEEYLNYCDHLTQGVLKSPKIELDKKIGFLFNQAEMTFKQCQDLGVTNDVIAQAQRNIKNTAYLTNSKLKKDEVLKSLLNGIKDFDHCAGVVIFSSMLAAVMNIDGQKMDDILGVAALFHDVGFEKNNDEVDYKLIGKKSYDTEKELLDRLKSKNVFAKEKKALEIQLKEHPLRSAKKMSECQSVNNTVLQVIEQHHSYEEKARGVYQGGPVHQLAGVIEIADDISHLMSEFNGTGKHKQFIHDKIKLLDEKYPRALVNTVCKLFDVSL